jgi:hypothetical protein
MLALIAAFLLPAASFLLAEEKIQNIDELKKTAPKVYLDGQRLDTNFIKTEIEFVNYVRDRKEADVHVLVSQQDTGSGGNEYTMSFIGLGSFEDLKNELKYFSNKIDTQDETRKGLVQVLKLGLTPFVARTPIAQILNLSFAGKVKQTSVEDRWDFWVFSFSARGRLNGEKSRKSNSLYGNFSINRVTPQTRLRLGISSNNERSEYNYDDYQSTSTSRSRSIDGLYVFSLGEHWSVGAILNMNASTYSNIKFGVSFHPAIEFNIFPYSESTRRQLRILYRIGVNSDQYLETTIYDKLKEKTVSHALSVTFESREPWGNAELSLEASSFFHDFSKNRFKVQGNLSFRIIKGLSLTVDGRYSAVRDQLALRKGEVSVEELLLRRTELASGYTYQMTLGLSYSFGSVYSNVVNPRFGGGFGGSSGGYSDHY